MLMVLCIAAGNLVALGSGLLHSLSAILRDARSI
jgi:hypothetical protein